MPQLQDFQFYNTPRIQALYEKMAAREVWLHQRLARAQTIKSQVGGCTRSPKRGPRGGENDS